MTKTESKDITWINTGRAICMLCVYIAHCNAYYLWLDSPIYFVFKPFYMSFFFFISGFLFFRETQIFPFKKKIKGLAEKLIWPTLLFPTLIWLPKNLVHGNNISILNYIYDVFGGTASWFVSALVVAQIISLICIFFFRNIFAVLATSIITLFTAFFLAEIDPTPFPWYYKSGMVAVFFMALGGLFNRYYDKLKNFISKRNLIISGILFFGIMLVNYYYIGVTQHIMIVKYDNIPLGLFNNLLGIFFMIQASHYIPKIKWMQYIGKNTLVFYFMAGGIPLIMGAIAKHFIPFHGYITTFVITALCVAIVFPITYIINKFFPWMLDFSKITNKLKHTK